jgi:hypothetical protein
MKNIATLILLALIAACSHPVEIAGEGDVMTESARGCTWEESTAIPVSDKCAKNYVVGAYVEKYTAEPRNGWRFDSWVNCAFTGISIAAGNTCTFNVPAATVIKFWGKTLPPLRAVFVKDSDQDGVPDIKDNCPATPQGDMVDAKGCTVVEDADNDGAPDVTDNCPDTSNADQADFNTDGEGDACDDSDGDGILDIDDACRLDSKNACIVDADIVKVNGREWAQPDLFTSLSWGEINQLCPIAEGGVCKKAVYEEDRLKGYDMEGWTWASIADVNGLFNYFLADNGVTGEDLLSGIDYYVGYDYGGWGAAFFAAGFRGTAGTRSLEGLVSTLHNGCCKAYIGTFQDFDDPEPDWAMVFFYEPSIGKPNVGAFFYRQAP